MVVNPEAKQEYKTPRLIEHGSMETLLQTYACDTGGDQYTGGKGSEVLLPASQCVPL